MLEKLKRFDYLFALAVTALAVFGIIMIYSATNLPVMPESVRADSTDLYESQILFVVSGAVLMLVLAFIDYRFIGKFYIFIYALCIILLVVVKLIGTDNPSDTMPDRWILIPVPGLGRAISIQPSEFAKIFMIIVLAKFIDAHKDNFNHILMLLFILVGIALPVGLVAWQPSLSASFVVLVISMVVLFTGGLHYRTIFFALLIIVPLVFLVWLDLQRTEPFISQILSPYQWGRVQTYLNPSEADPNKVHQLEASLYSIGSGGLYGKGFLKNTYIPYGHNDFAFSVVAEQFGFVGCMGILGIMAFLIIKCVLIALRAADLQGRLIASGAAGMLLFETFVHVGVGTGILPTTGIVFPFLSSGGSITWVHMAAMGLVLSVAISQVRGRPNRERDIL